MDALSTAPVGRGHRRDGLVAFDEHITASSRGCVIYYYGVRGIVPSLRRVVPGGLSAACVEQSRARRRPMTAPGARLLPEE